jgi:hypothetical protein
MATAALLHLGLPSGSRHNKVEVLPFDYFKATSRIDHDANEPIKTDCCNFFTLNTEQERAFRLIADNASTKPQAPLRMHLGGMGGSERSQVIKAVARFFELRNENHRFMILGPTGSTAPL